MKNVRGARTSRERCVFTSVAIRRESFSAMKVGHGNPSAALALRIPRQSENGCRLFCLACRDFLQRCSFIKHARITHSVLCALALRPSEEPNLTPNEGGINCSFITYPRHCAKDRNNLTLNPNKTIKEFKKQCSLGTHTTD